MTPRRRIAAADRIQEAGWRAAWRVVRFLPAPVAYGLFDLAARVAARRGGAGVRRLTANYRVVRPELGPRALRRLASRGMRSYLRYWCDAFRMPGWAPAEFDLRTRVIGADRLAGHIAGGRGVVLALPHQGNWDQAGAWCGQHLGDVLSVAEHLEPEAVFQDFLAYRRALGMEVLALGDEDVIGRLRARLREGGLVALVCDRAMGRGGVPVRLCGTASRMAGGPAVLALATGAPLLPVTTHYERVRTGHGRSWRLVVVIHDPVPVPSVRGSRAKVEVMCQRLADVFGAALRTDTADWHMLQRIFDGSGAGTTAAGAAHVGR